MPLKLLGLVHLEDDEEDEDDEDDEDVDAVEDDAEAYPSATSRLIMTTNPTMAPQLAARPLPWLWGAGAPFHHFTISPLPTCASGMMSSTTT